MKLAMDGKGNFWKPTKNHVGKIRIKIQIINVLKQAEDKT